MQSLIEVYIDAQARNFILKTFKYVYVMFWSCLQWCYNNNFVSTFRVKHYLSTGKLLTVVKLFIEFPVLVPGKHYNYTLK